MAPDPLVGKPKDFFYPKPMINAMSPPGIKDYEMRKLLAEAKLDAVQ
jgi:hypothetical protein